MNGWMSGGGWADEWMEQPRGQKQKLTKGPDREKFRCLLLVPPVPCSTLLLCSRRLTALTTTSGLPAQLGSSWVWPLGCPGRRLVEEERDSLGHLLPASS